MWFPVSKSRAFRERHEMNPRKAEEPASETKINTTASRSKRVHNRVGIEWGSRPQLERDGFEATGSGIFDEEGVGGRERGRGRRGGILVSQFRDLIAVGSAGSTGPGVRTVRECCNALSGLMRDDIIGFEVSSSLRETR
jgi:hypothetical protein